MVRVINELLELDLPQKRKRKFKMAVKIIKAFLILIAVSGCLIILMYLPILLGLSQSSVRVINNLNVYSEQLRQQVIGGQLKTIDQMEDNITKSNSFRIHDKDKETIKNVIEEKPVINKIESNTKEDNTKTDSDKSIPEKDKITEGKKEEKVEEKVDGLLPPCSKKGTNLVGPLFIDQSIPKDMSVIEKTLSVEYGGTVEKGGTWSPTTCIPQHKVAIIIPYRKRMSQLKIFLKYMHPFLQKQLLSYRIFLVEQLYKDPFNRAGLFNVGYTEALKISDEFDCFIFTDVDLLPEDDRNHYGCPTSPRHMSVAVDKFHYKLPYATIFGGVGAFKRRHFEEINGMSNLFFGWGGEDDDLYKRVQAVDLDISRPPQQIGRYQMISVGHHQSSHQDPNSVSLLHTSEQRMVVDVVIFGIFDGKSASRISFVDFGNIFVAIIIPYRKRFEQLKIFLRHMHPFLQRQELFYRIIVVEQLHDDPFNRAGLFNVGFHEALKLADFDCFIFTDVDLLPEDDHNYYGCPTSPRHMSVAVDKFNYRLPYPSIFGGVGAFTRKDFERINGFSNMFWGWGGEDDDLYARITSVGFKLTRPSIRLGRYTMIRIHHFQSSKADPNRMNLLKNSAGRMTADGLNTLKYNLEKRDELPLVTFARVELKRSMYS